MTTNCKICEEPLSDEDAELGFCSNSALCAANARVLILSREVTSLNAFKNKIMNTKMKFPVPGSAEFEKHAGVQHEIWSHWMKYLFSICKTSPSGSISIPITYVERWKEQITTPYHVLSEKEKESDREMFMKHLNA